MLKFLKVKWIGFLNLNTFYSIWGRRRCNISIIIVAASEKKVLAEYTTR